MVCAGNCKAEMSAGTYAHLAKLGVKGYTTANNSNNSNNNSPINTSTTSQVYAVSLGFDKQVPTSWKSTPQQQTILQAMEAQKAREKTMTVAEQNAYYVDSKPNKSTYTFNGVDVTAQTEKQLAKQRETQRINDQMSQDFKNRTNEQILQNFIVTRINEEQKGVSPNTNLSAYVTERGFDVTQPEKIPTSILKPTRLDTPEKLIQAGLSPSLVNVVLAEKYPQNVPVTDNPQVQTMNIPASQRSAVTSNPQLATMISTAQQIKAQRDIEVLIAAQESGRHSSAWFKATGTSDKMLQLERVILGAGGGADQIRAAGYPIPVFKAGTFDTIVPFEETELGRKILGLDDIDRIKILNELKLPPPTPPKPTPKIVEAVVDIVVPPVVSAVIQPEKQKTDTGITVDTSVPARPEVNWSGLTDTRTINLPVFQRRTTNQDNLFNPPEAENTNQPVGALLPDTPIEKKSNLAIPLLAGSLLFML